MTRIYMIRHGKAAAGWDGDADSGLNELGLAQAKLWLKRCKRWSLGPCRYIPARSNVARNRRAAGRSLGCDAANRSRCGRNPPPLEDLTARTYWLRRVMAGTWEGLYSDPVSVESGVDFRRWNENVVSTLNAFKGEAVVIFSHFVALNAAYCVPPPAQQMSSASRRKIVLSPSSTRTAQACHWSRRATRPRI